MNRSLVGSGAGFLVATLVHIGDHTRRGWSELSGQVLVAGSIGAVFIAVGLYLAFTGHRLAPLAATAVGWGMFVGLGAVHLLPDWGPFSDSLLGSDVDLTTWVIALFQLSTAGVFGVVGSLAVRDSGIASAVLVTTD